MTRTGEAVYRGATADGQTLFTLRADGTVWIVLPSGEVVTVSAADRPAWVRCLVEIEATYKTALEGQRRLDEWQQATAAWGC